MSGCFLAQPGSRRFFPETVGLRSAVDKRPAPRSYLSRENDTCATPRQHPTSDAGWAASRAPGRVSVLTALQIELHGTLLGGGL